MRNSGLHDRFLSQCWSWPPAQPGSCWGWSLVWGWSLSHAIGCCSAQMANLVFRLEAHTQSGVVGLHHLQGPLKLSVCSKLPLWIRWVSFCSEALRGSQHLDLVLVWCAAPGMVIFSLEWSVMLASRVSSHSATAHCMGCLGDCWKVLWLPEML